MYFSSVLSSPFFPSLKKKECYLKLCGFSKTVIFFICENGPLSLSQGRQLLCSQKKTEVGSGVFFLCVVIIGYVEYK